MKKLSIICSLILFLGLMSTPDAFGIASFCKDALEDGNPGGFGSCDTTTLSCNRDENCPLFTLGETCVQNSFKTFDETIVVEESDTVFIDIWANGLTHSSPEGLTYGSFQVTWDSSIELVDVYVYDGDLAGVLGTHDGTTSVGLLGLWDGSMTRTELTTGLLKVKAGQLSGSGAPCDATGDIPIAKLKIHCVATGMNTMTVDTIEGFVSVVSGIDVYEYDDEIEPNTFTITCEGVPECTTDADCDDGIYCNGAESCVDNVCQAGSNPCPDDGLYCTGVESCSENTDVCETTGNPCTPPLVCNEDDDICEVPPECTTDADCDDGMYCNGAESCVDNVCQAGSNPCPDDGLYCTGAESCDEGTDQCVSSGNPCPPGYECDEDENVCVQKECVTITIGDADGAPGEENVPVEVGLTNLNDRIRGIQIDLCEEIDGSPVDYLNCTGCEAEDDRAPFFRCSINEREDGCCRVIFVNDQGTLIEKGTGTIFTIKYDVSEDAPGGCEDLTMKNAKVADEFEDPLPICEPEPGEFCFMVCGDIAPLTGPGPNDCGDFEVDINDVVDMIDIVLGIIAVPTDCQWAKGDVPNGLPLPGGTGCREPNAEIDIFDILVIIDVVLGIDNCCW